MIHYLEAGAATADITPIDSQFLFGYPHVKRFSTGVHDPLLSSALYLTDNKTELMFIANDIIFVSKAIVDRVRKRISTKTGLAPGRIMISATHTHSGPITVNMISNSTDPAVPPVDEAYVQRLEDGMVQAAIKAWRDVQPAKLGLVVARVTGIGSNRRDPSGPSDPQVPVLVAKSRDGVKNIACMLICSMHPTVLHEDSTLISGDIPGLTRQYLQSHQFSPNTPVLYHTGPSGNQSPRHVTRSNTFKEATRLSQILGKAVAGKMPKIRYKDDLSLASAQRFIDLPIKSFPGVPQAEKNLSLAVQRLNTLRKQNASSQQIRTAECDWFGAEETLALAKAAQDGYLESVYQSCLPAEIQIFKIGNWSFIAWPGEQFVEYSLAVKQKDRNAFVISLANGELQGYIVTQEAEKEAGYEASNALFEYKSGDILVEQTLDMLKTLNQRM